MAAKTPLLNLMGFWQSALRKIENDYVATTAKRVGNHLSPRRWQGTNGYQNNPGAIGAHWKPNALWAALVDPFAKAKFLPSDS